MRKPIRLSICLLPLALSGCFAMTVKGMRKHEPVLVADSTRDTNAILGCVSEAWQKRGAAPRSVPRANGGTLLIDQPGLFTAMPVMVLDIDTLSTGNHVTMRLFKAISGKANRARVAEVRACL